MLQLAHFRPFESAPRTVLGCTQENWRSVPIGNKMVTPNVCNASTRETANPAWSCPLHVAWQDSPFASGVPIHCACLVAELSRPSKAGGLRVTSHRDLNTSSEQVLCCALPLSDGWIVTFAPAPNVSCTGKVYRTSAAPNTSCTESWDALDEHRLAAVADRSKDLCGCSTSMAARMAAFSSSIRLTFS